MEQSFLNVFTGNETELMSDLVVKDPLGQTDRNMIELHYQFANEKRGPETIILI